MKITVVGTGYVGLVTGACLAEMGNHVVCLDRDPGRIATLLGGELPIHEPGLLDIMLRNTRSVPRLICRACARGLWPGPHARSRSCAASSVKCIWAKYKSPMA